MNSHSWLRHNNPSTMRDITSISNLVSYVLMLLMLAGCTQQASSLKVLADNKSIATAPLSSSIQALNIHQYRTTNGDIYLGNLNSRIQSLNKLANNTAAHRLLLASSLFHRFRITGKHDDLNAAQQHISTYLQGDPQTIDNKETGLILQASIYSATHQFDQALAILNKTSGKASLHVQTLQAEILLAQGQYEQAKTTINLLEDSAQPAADSQVLSLQANLTIEQGNLAQGLQLFNQAQLQFNKTNPLTLAWLQTQMGIALLRNQHIAEAHKFFIAAHQRLPAYYLATEHQAECEFILGNLLAAEKLYASVSQQTENPEFYAMLAKVQKQAGKINVAAQNSQIAEQSYLKLLDTQPQAFAQHAAQFFYDIGKLSKALELAELNLQNRHDIHSWLLLSQIKLALQQPDKACAALANANNTGMHPPELEAAKKNSECGFISGKLSTKGDS